MENRLLFITTDELERIVSRAVRVALDDLRSKPTKEIMTKAELAEYLSCSVSKVNAYMGKGLPFVTFGEHPRFRKSEIDRWLTNERVQGIQQKEAQIVEG